MIYQLRTYTINRGMMEPWVSLFNDKLVGIMDQYGIGVDDAWVNEDQNQFIWTRSFADSDDIPVKEAAFYGSPEWNSVMDHARSHIARIQVDTVNSVLKPSKSS